jgi:hypothetical protein
MVFACWPTTMDECAWLTSTDPQRMLDALRESGRASERKLRLFAVACSRRVWAQIDTFGRAAVEIAEQFADGAAGAQELRAARLACKGAGGQSVWYAAATDPAVAARNAALSAQSGTRGSEAERIAQSTLLRDIFGPLPFRPVPVEPSWRTAEIVDLVQTIYEQRSFEPMPELADLLEKAGCTNEDILSHCRGPGPHTRGCWVLDLLVDRS